MQSQNETEKTLFMMSNGVGLPGAKGKRGFSVRRGSTLSSQAGVQS